jgi:hypothetical protein
VSHLNDVQLGKGILVGSIDAGLAVEEVMFTSLHQVLLRPSFKVEQHPAKLACWQSQFKTTSHLGDI